MSASSLALVADVGGTNARFGIADLDTLEVGRFEVFLGQDHPTLAGAAALYLDGLDVRPRFGAFAVAAPVTDDTIRFTNSPWTFRRTELRQALGFDELLLLNDFEALARSDAAAEAALDHFVTWAGRFAGDVALLYGARGGVYLGGGIPPRILGALTTGRFRAAFEAKGRMSAYVAAIPAYVILSGDTALKGAAAALGAALASRGS